MAPRLNLTADPLLLGLIARALVPAEPSESAELTQRRLEHLRMQETELLKQLSPLRSDVETRRRRLHDKDAELRRASADLTIFDQQNPGYADPRAKTARGPQASELARRRSELSQMQQFSRDDSQRLASELESLDKRAALLEAEQRANAALREELTTALRGSAVVYTFDMLCRGEAEMALRWLAEMRQLLRGDLMTGVLIVLSELFLPTTSGQGNQADGVRRARAALLELRSLFEQHSDPLPRVLEALIMLREGRQLDSRALALYQSAQFSQPAHFRLSQLVSVLSGLELAPSPQQHGLFELTLKLLAQHVELARSGREPQQILLQQSDDLVCSLLEAALLLAAGQSERIPGSVGLDFEELGRPEPQGLLQRIGAALGAAAKQSAGAELLTLLESLPAAAWPASLLPIWRGALACYLLLAAKDSAPEALYSAWLAQSYGWPKQDLYWWTLAGLNEDRELLRNLTRSPHELFSIEDQ